MYDPSARCASATQLISNLRHRARLVCTVLKVDGDHFSVVPQRSAQEAGCQDSTRTILVLGGEARAALHRSCMSSFGPSSVSSTHALGHHILHHFSSQRRPYLRLHYWAFISSPSRIRLCRAHCRPILRDPLHPCCNASPPTTMLHTRPLSSGVATYNSPYSRFDLASPMQSEYDCLRIHWSCACDPVF